jgi:hypothetical protein
VDAVSTDCNRTHGREITRQGSRQERAEQRECVALCASRVDPLFYLLANSLLRSVGFVDQVLARSRADLLWIRAHWLQITAVSIFIVIPILGEQWLYETYSLTYQLAGGDQELLRNGSRVLFAGLAGGISGAFSPGGKRGICTGFLLGIVFAGVSEFWMITETRWLVYYFPVHSLYSNDIHMVRKLTLLGKCSKVVIYALIGGLYTKSSGGNFSQGFKWCLVVSAMSETALSMRSQGIIDSFRDPQNYTGVSAGFKHDDFKLAGGRVNPNLSEQKPSPLGGRQGGQGAVLGKPYDPGSFPDRIVESYAGPHDYLNSFIWYDQTGNVKMGLTSDKIVWWIFKIIDMMNIAVASPFVIASVTPLAIVMLLYAPAKERKKARENQDTAYTFPGGWFRRLFDQDWLDTPALAFLRQQQMQTVRIRATG